MFSNKEAWMEGYEAGYAAAQEEIDKLTDVLFITRNTANALQRNICGLKADLDRVEAERDALLADVKDYQGSICCYCKHIQREKGVEPQCAVFGDFPTSNEMPLECGRWEWRGLSLEKNKR